MKMTNTSEENQLVRTDSTTLCYLGYKKTNGNKLTPLGRERRIQRWQRALIEECNNYYK